MTPKYVHVLTPRPVKHLNLHGERDFAYGIQLRNFRGGDYPRLQGEHNVITRILINVTRVPKLGERSLDDGSRYYVMKPGAQECQQPLRGGRFK
jgi:hypothetical protein